LDNFSQEKNEGDIDPKIPKNSGDSDIQFEEILDIDKIQQRLQQQFGEVTEFGEFSDESKDIISEKGTSVSMGGLPPQQSPNAKTSRLEVNPKDKKYVVYIDYDNIDFMEHLSPADRKETINKILKDQYIAAKKKKVAEEQARFVKHLIVAVITFIIGFPLLFICVNKAMELTMLNFKEARSNFSKLYKEQGKIKSKDSPSATNFKY